MDEHRAPRARPGARDGGGVAREVGSRLCCCTWPLGRTLALSPLPRRLSIAFFSGPHDDAVVETIPSCVDCAAGGGGVRLRQPITAGGHLQRKILATRVGATVGA